MLLLKCCCRSELHRCYRVKTLDIDISADNHQCGSEKDVRWIFYRSCDMNSSPHWHWISCISSHVSALWCVGTKGFHAGSDVRLRVCSSDVRFCLRKFLSSLLLLASFHHIHHFLHWRQLVEERTRDWPDLWDEAYVRKLPVIVSSQPAGETLAGCRSRTAPHRPAPHGHVWIHPLWIQWYIHKVVRSAELPAEDVVLRALIWSNGRNMRWIERTPPRPSMRGSCGHLPLCAAG